jgi:xanthine dehydrogenase small subunit
MSLHLIDDLYKMKMTGQTLHIGARVNLDSLQQMMETHVPAFANFLNIFASPQIKNSATLIGNLANGSPIADTTPFLMCMDAKVDLMGTKGVRQKPIVEFFKGYKKFDIEDDEFITGIHFDIPDVAKTKLGLYKISQRRDLDISCVNSCFLFRIEAGQVKEAKISYGGVGPVPLRLHAVEKQLIGQSVDQKFLADTKNLITNNIQPISDVRGTAEFRKLMAPQLFEKFAKECLGL